jgi:hypothetical protein
VECGAEGEDGGKVCRNTKYVKGKRVDAAAPEADTGIPTTASAGQLRDEDAELSTPTADEAGDFYEADEGEL